MRGRPVVSSNGGYRKKVKSSRRDKRDFSATAGMTNGVNLRSNPLRGGIRL